MKASRQEARKGVVVSLYETPRAAPSARRLVAQVTAIAAVAVAAHFAIPLLTDMLIGWLQNDRVMVVSFLAPI
jgi:hypothetical protein